jgi:hypothetical protein
MEYLPQDPHSLFPKQKYWLPMHFFVAYSPDSIVTSITILNLLIRTKHKNLFGDIICSFTRPSTSFNDVDINLGNNYLKEALQSVEKAWLSNRLFFDKGLSTGQWEELRGRFISKADAHRILGIYSFINYGIVKLINITRKSTMQCTCFCRSFKVHLTHLSDCKEGIQFLQISETV